jgi:lysophospholipid acyltransferase (LPLAT)-like uncharacterized protein
MADGVTIDTVRSGSSGVLDSPAGPNEAIANGEAVLARRSSCGVTVIEKHAHDTGVPLRILAVVIEGGRHRRSLTSARRRSP